MVPSPYFVKYTIALGTTSIKNMTMTTSRNIIKNRNLMVGNLKMTI